MFTSCDRGFQITFENGYKVSIQLYPFTPFKKEVTNDLSDRDYTFDHAETALLNKHGQFVPYGKTKEYDEVQGHMSPAEVLELLNYAAQL